MNNNLSRLDNLCFSMIQFFGNDNKRIHHFLKVKEFASLIAKSEKVDEKLLELIQAAALVHDCGIKIAEEKYGHQNGKLQEQEGPAVALTLLKDCNYDENTVQRICYLVGHHHTYSNIDGIDYQILVEADFLVNFYEDEIKIEGIKTAVNKIFKTKTGIELANSLFDIK